MAHLVLFEVAGQTFALPAEALVRVADPVPVTPLPFVGGDIEGLVSAGGSIVAQIDLGRRLGLAPCPGLPSALMLVRINGRPVALRISRHLARAEIEDGEIRAPGADAGPLIAGNTEWQERAVTLLRLERLGIDDLTPGASGRPVALLGEPEPRQGAAAPTAAVLRSLMVRCGGLSYALPLDRVQEVVTVERLTALPNAPTEILGLTVLRGSPLPVLSLARLLGTDDAGSRKNYPLALIGHDRHRFALAVDAILGLRRLPLSDLHSLTKPQSGISGYYIGAHRAPAGMIDLDTLLATGSAERLLAFLPAGTGEDAAKPRPPEPERRFLTFLIGTETFGIDLERVERIAEHQPPLPLPGRRHAALAGMVEIAGKVVPMADLRRPLGRPTTVTRRTALVLARGSCGVWALVVDRLSRIVKVPVSAIKAANAGQHFIGEIARLDRAFMPILDPTALDSIAG